MNAPLYSDRCWYHRKAGAERTIFAAVDAARSKAATQRSEDSHYLRLYDEREWSMYQLEQGGTARARAAEVLRARKGRKLSENVVKSCVDGWTNLICRDRPHVNYLTKGADWSLQKKARLRTRFVEAHYLKRGLYGLASRVAKHAGIFGRGFVHVVKSHKRIDYEIVPPWEVVVDPTEAIVNDPRCMYRVRTIDVGEACALWPDHAKALRASGDQRLVLIDAWHLPSGPKADDGVHAQIIPGVVTLKWAKYRWEAFPIVEFFFDDCPVSWGGTGLAAELEGVQYEINSVLRTIQNNVYFGGNIKAAFPRGSGVQPSQLSNALGCPTVEYNDTGGGRPVFHTADMGLEPLLGYLQTLKTGAFEKTGISQLNAQSQTPFATMSGRARLIHNQAYSQRFKTHHDRYEDWFKRIADRTLEAAADLADSGEDVEIIFPGRNHLETIKYSDVAGEIEDFDSDVWTASLSGETPGGRLAHIEQMMSLGMIDLAAAMELYEIPMDLRAHMDRVLAPIELAREAIDKIIEDGVPVTPTPMMNLALAAEFAQMWYQRGMLRGVEWQRLYLLLDFHKLCVMMLNSAQPANDAGAAPAQGQPAAPAAAGAPVAPELAAALPGAGVPAQAVGF